MIKVKLKPEQGIKVRLTPSQSAEVSLKTVYLYDPDWIPEINKAVSDAKESADNAKVSEQNAAQSASDADADATNAAESATIAYNSEQNAIEQANKATEEANAAAESAYQAQTSALAAHEYASNAEADAQNALETLGHVLEAETNATNAANTAIEQAGIATEKAAEAGTHATNASVSATNAKTSEDNAKNYELGAKGYSETATQEANASAESAYQSQQSALASAQYASDAESDAQNALETLGHVLESETISTNAANTATQKAQEASESAADAQESAEEAQRIKDSLGNIYVFKGSVATFEDLPTNASIGDVYDVLDTGKNYAWDGSKWDDIGGTVDLSSYAKTSYVDGREQAIREDYMQADSELQTQINGHATAITEAQGDIVNLQNNKQDVISDLDTIRSGAGKGSTAVQPSDLSAVATSGSYNDLTNKPTIPSATSQLTNDSDYTTKNYVDTTEQEIIENYMQADTDLQTQITGLSGTVATNHADIVNLKSKKYGADLSYADSQLQLLDQDGNAIGTAVEITSGGGSVDVDNLSITENTSGQIQTVGVIDQNNTTNAIKTWSGTKAQYDAIATKDANTLYNITDDTDLGLNLLQTLYPVGSIYIGVMSVCPLGALFGTWTKVASDRVLQGAGTRGAVGSTVEESLPNITGYFNSGSNSTTSSGAFVTNNVTATGAGSTGSVSGRLDFNASRSSSTYQDNAPVQQDAYLVNIWQRIA